MNANVTFDSLLDDCRQLRLKCQSAGFYVYICLLETLPEVEQIHYKSVAFTNPDMHPFIIKQLQEEMKEEKPTDAPPQKTA